MSFVLHPVADAIKYQESAAALLSSGTRPLCLLSCVGDSFVTVVPLSTAVGLPGSSEVLPLRGESFMKIFSINQYFSFVSLVLSI